MDTDRIKRRRKRKNNVRFWRKKGGLMRKTVLLMLISLIMAVPAFAREPMKMVYFENYQPFSWLDEGNQMRGILIDALNETIRKRMKISVTHKGYPWKRAQKMVKAGKADAFVTVPTPERESYTKISNEAVTTVKVTVFAGKGNPKMEKIRKIRTIADLKDFTLISYLGAGWAKKNLAKFNVKWVSDLDTVLKIIAKGRSPLFIQPSKVTLFNIKRLGYQDQIIEIPDVILDSIDFKLCIGKKSSYLNILSEFDEMMKTIRKDGTLQKIYDKYK